MTNISKILGMESEQSKIVPNLLNKSFLCLKEIIKLSGNSEVLDQEAKSQAIATAHVELANFCNRFLRLEEAGSVEGFSPAIIPTFHEFPAILTESLLTALNYGVTDALLLFPRLLQIIELHPNCLPIFQKKTSEMPCWLFIGWINQMVALLDKPESKAVHEIIENISLAYPEAVFYAFHLSYESYKFPGTLEGRQNKAFVEKLKSNLKRETLIWDFVNALQHLSIPSVIFKDYVSDIIRLVNRKTEAHEIEDAFTAMYRNLFAINEGDKIGDVPIGPMQKKFAKDYKDEVLEVCGINGCKLLKTSEQKSAVEKLNKVAEKARQSTRKISSLKEISPWLSEFQPWRSSVSIEIPGQYTGKAKPLPEYHVKIAGFDEKILMLSSLTRPCRITIRGNDEKEYKILIKTGEDLRQDARIQQLFSVMNEIYAGDPKCSEKHYRIQTYKVVPLNSRLGIIEWLDNTAVLDEFLTDGMSEGERSTFLLKDGRNIAQVKFMQWEKHHRNLPDMYFSLYKNKSHEVCVKKFEELVNSVPKNLFMKSFMKLSSSPEAFVALRAKFAASHAVICIAQWVLGIGDRHLRNFLISKNSGNEIGIDFGHAFGSATQFLSVPELMPFRLSPQYLQLMDPMKVKGIYETTMVHTLSALHKRRDLLLNVMDIFIKEPTIDWKVHASKQEQALGGNKREDDWFPKQRVNIARMKLEGMNPCYITRQELKLGHCMKPSFESMEAVCMGDSKHNIRATLSKRGLSIEEQVDCLIDQATDPHLLCLTYFGWNPWL